MSDTDAAVLIIGEALIDVVEREGERTEHVGGSPANVAIGAARLGADVELWTAIGADAYGGRIASHVSSSGARLGPHSVRAAATATAVAVIDDKGSARYLFDIGWEPAFGPLGIRRVVHAGSIGLFLEPGADAVLALLEDAARDGALVTVDPNVRPAITPDRAQVVARFERAVRSAHLVKLSDEDAAWLYPGTDEDEVVRRISELGALVVLVTRGERGVRARTMQRDIVMPAFVVDVADTIGAGDAFMASLVDDLASQGALTDDRLGLVLRRALAAAAMTVTIPGADPPLRDQRDAFLLQSGCDRRVT
ncbi:MAG: hypothetical protein ABS62_02310 [Microbacterium sp. SCN 70-200]|uniref:PfkB family carbohydrate kinase n=1 Tax=unclassified Microbacterium TaxID=2609290 RepID=UPI00086E3F80|nr:MULTISPECIES: PfkB family carbohydrate kinase [unclassified Microbacterium]MBN9215328.1 carbohydrate kinase [Microbacterium sp.]ODT42726.1 MAG: hypothetical protein ABS62_02310 [Microbacterium sp. SCN 70-200]OJV79931.1 MAG: hypothetical protein BGO46_06720 [Microbacterium sp. 70-16]